MKTWRLVETAQKIVLSSLCNQIKLRQLTPFVCPLFNFFTSSQLLAKAKLLFGPLSTSMVEMIGFGCVYSISLSLSARKLHNLCALRSYSTDIPLHFLPSTLLLHNECAECYVRVPLFFHHGLLRLYSYFLNRPLCQSWVARPDAVFTDLTVHSDIAYV